MSFPLFKDISKSANDLLKKGYPTAEKYAFRVEFDSVSESGIQVTPFLQETLDKTIEGELKAKFTVKEHQITTTGNMKEDVSFELAAAKPSSRGIKYILNLTSNLTDFADKAKGKATLEIKNDVSTTSFSLEHPFKQGAAQKSDESKVVLSSVFGSKERGLSFGFDTDFSVSSFALKFINTSIAYNKSDIDVVLFSKKKLGGSTQVGANYFQKLHSEKWREAQLGGEISFDINDKSSAFVLGAAFKPSDSSTVKARFESKGLLGFVYTEKWSGPLSVTFGSDWNVLGAANASPFQYSIKLAFK